MKSTALNDFTSLPALDRPNAALAPSTLPPVPIPGLYIHIPFCFHKCHYCDFYSLPGQTNERMHRFVHLLLAEADLWAHSPTGPLVRPQTIFIGGGTPTLLPLAYMLRLITGLRQRFDLSNLNEFTIEANPATVTPEYCAALYQHAVTRLSFGAQSFHAAELAVLERRHNPSDVAASIQTARAAGFKRLNVDLIYAIPGQDLPSFAYSLDSVIALQPEHISAYNLTYARPTEECRHNLLYWNGGSYIGLGPSAASHLDGLRFRNQPHLGDWEQAIQSQTLPAIDLEHLCPLRRAGELAMLQLRLATGINFSQFTSQTHFDPRHLWPTLLTHLHQLSLIELDNHGFRLTPQGINVADAIAAEFLDPEPGTPTTSLTPTPHADTPTLRHSDAPES
ncbi:MAG: coproporphyrinogen-III oxidase family protein [Planctomycetota bacterium]|nr:coproporphyrinogen-III oxidase family protein [Planctomycetota bacterium]